MKRFKKIIYLGMILPILSSCFEEPGTEIILEDQFVAFNVTGLQINENAGAGQALVELSQAQSGDVQVTFELTTSNSVAGVDFVLSGNSVTIPAGQFSASIPFTVVDNELFEPLPRSFTLTLASVSVAGIRIEANPSITVTILNDDCPANAAIWFGDVSIEDVGYGTAPGTGAANAAGDCNILVVTGDYVGAVAPVTWELIPASPGAQNGIARAVRQDFNCCATAYEYEAEGTYDETTGIIEADYIFYNKTSGAVLFPGTTVITAN